MRVNGIDYGGEDTVEPFVVRGTPPGRTAAAVIHKLRSAQSVLAEIAQSEREIARFEESLVAAKLRVVSARTLEEQRAARRARSSAWDSLRRWRERDGLLRVELHDSQRATQ